MASVIRNTTQALFFTRNGGINFPIHIRQRVPNIRDGATAFALAFVSDGIGVETIDIDPELTAQARLRLEELLGPGTILLTGDGKRDLLRCSLHI